MVCVAVGTVETSRVEGAIQVRTPGDDKIKLVSVARPRMSVRDFVPIYTLKYVLVTRRSRCSTILAVSVRSRSFCVCHGVQDRKARYCSRLPL
jgi:hypothetical protein